MKEQEICKEEFLLFQNINKKFPALHRGKANLTKRRFEAKELKTIKAPGAFELPCLASPELKSRSWDC